MGPRLSSLQLFTPSPRVDPPPGSRRKEKVPATLGRSSRGIRPAGLRRRGAVSSHFPADGVHGPRQDCPDARGDHRGSRPPQGPLRGTSRGEGGGYQ